jgi:hypothetical protein
VGIKRAPTVTPQPVIVTAQRVGDETTVVWAYATPTFDFTGFDVYRNGVFVERTTSLEHVDPATPAADTQYDVVAVRTNPRNNKEYPSVPASVVVPYDVLVPRAPTGLSATFSEAGAQLSWVGPDTAPDSYRLHTGTSPTGPFTPFVGDILDTEYLDEAAPVDAYRYGYVTAITDGQESDPSNIIGWQAVSYVDTEETWSVQVNDPDETGVSAADDANYTSGSWAPTTSDAQWGRTSSLVYRKYIAFFKYTGSPAAAGTINVVSAFRNGFARGASNNTDMFADTRGIDVIPVTPIPDSIIEAEALPRTTASVAWDVPAATVWAAGSPVSGNDLVTIFQELFDTHDVAPGDMIGLVVEPRVGVAVVGNLRTIASGDIGTTSLRPTLTVVQTVPMLQDTVGPAQPQNFTGVDITSAIHFEWTANVEADLHHYELLQNGVVVDSFIDPAATSVNYVPEVGGTFTYTLVAYDDADNPSPPSAGVVSPFDVEDPVTNPAGFDSGYYNITIDLDVSSDTGQALSPNKLSGDYQIATTGTALTSGTTLNVATPMPIALPDGTPLPVVDNGVVKMAVLNGASLKGATALTVDPLASGIASGSTIYFTGVMYSVTTLNDWRFGFPLYRTTEAGGTSRLTGSIHPLVPGTTYDVRISLLDTVADTEEVQLEQAATYALPTFTEVYADRDFTLGTGGTWTTLAAMITSLNTAGWWTTYGSNHALIGVKNESFAGSGTQLNCPVGKTITLVAETNVLLADHVVNGSSFPMIFDRFVSPHGVTDAQSKVDTTTTPAWTETGPGTNVWQLNPAAAAGITVLQYIGYSTTKTGTMTKVFPWPFEVNNPYKLGTLANAINLIQTNDAYNWGLWKDAGGAGNIYFIAPTGSSFDPNDHYMWISNQVIGNAEAIAGLDIACPGVKIIGIRARGMTEGFRFRQNAMDCAAWRCHDDGNTAGFWGFQSSDVNANADRLYLKECLIQDSSLWDEAHPDTLGPWDLVKQWIARTHFACTSATVSGTTMTYTVPGHDVLVGHEVVLIGSSSDNHNNAKRFVTAVTTNTITVPIQRNQHVLTGSSTGGQLYVYYPLNQLAQKAGETQGVRASRSGRFWTTENCKYDGKFNGMGASKGTGRQHYWGWYSLNDEYMHIGDNPIEPDGEVSAVCWVIDRAHIHDSRSFFSTDSAFGPHYVRDGNFYNATIAGVGGDGTGGTDQYSGRGGAFWKGGTNFLPSAVWFVTNNTFVGLEEPTFLFTNAIGGGSATEGFYLRNNIFLVSDYLVDRDNASLFYWNENHNWWASTSIAAYMKFTSTYTTMAAYRAGRSQGANSNIIDGTTYEFAYTGAFKAADVVIAGLNDVDTGDLGLAPSSPFIDAGIPVPGRNHPDWFNGDAPDMGADEAA